MTWPDDKLLGFGLTVTDIDPELARPVAFAFSWMDFGKFGKARSGLVKPGVPIPTGLPGITDEDVEKRGGPLDRAIDGIMGILLDASTESIPVVGYMAYRDLTVLDRCYRRQYGSGLRSGGWEGVVVDPFVLDRGLDPDRKGSRALYDLATLYGVDPPRQSWYDRVTVSLMVTLAIAKRYPEIADLEPDELHGRQVQWYRDWVEKLIADGEPFAPEQADWPIYGDGKDRRKTEDAPKISARQAADLSIQLKLNHAIEDRQDRMDVLGAIVGRVIQSSRELTIPEYMEVARQIVALPNDTVQLYLRNAQERRGGIKPSIIDEKKAELLVDPDVGNASQKIVASTMKHVMKLTGTKVNELLREYGLPRTGSVADRRLRFYEFACRERAAGNESVEAIFTEWESF